MKPNVRPSRHDRHWDNLETLKVLADRVMVAAPILLAYPSRLLLPVYARTEWIEMGKGGVKGFCDECAEVITVLKQIHALRAPGSTHTTLAINVMWAWDEEQREKFFIAEVGKNSL